MTIILLCFINLLLFPSIINSLINHDKFKYNGVSSKYLAESFGMSDKGLIQLDYDITSANALSPPTSLLFVVINEGQKVGYYNSADDTSKCNLPSLHRQMIYNHGSITYQTTHGIDQYSLLLLQCRDSNPNNPTSITTTTTMKNPYPQGDNYQYLAFDTVTYLTVLEGLLIAYAILLIGLIGQILVNRPYVRIIHYLFLVTLILIFLNVIARYAEYRYANSFGEDLTSLQYFTQFTFHFSQFANLSVLLMLSLGWSLLRYFLTSREKQIIILSLTIYFIVGLASASCIGSDICNSLALGTFVMKNILYLIIVVAMNLTVSQLRTLFYHTPWQPSLIYQYTRTKQFQIFRATFIIYLLFPTAFLLLEALLFSWKDTWLTPTFTDLLDLCLYVHVGVMFGPINEHLLVRPFAVTREQHIRPE